MARYRQLIEDTLAGTSAACPVAMWRHHPVDDQQAGSLAAATLAFQDRFDFDFVKIMPPSAFQLRDYGLRDAWAGDPLGRRAVTARVIAQPEDWRALPALDPRRGFVARFGDCVSMVRGRLPAPVPVLMTVFNPLSQAMTLAGPDIFHDHLLRHRQAVAEGLRRIRENTIRLIDHFAAAGADGIFLAVQQAQAAQFDPDFYRDLALADDAACIAAAREGSRRALWFNLLHLHGAAIHATLFRDLGIALHYDAADGNPTPPELLAAGFPAVSTGPSADAIAGDGQDAIRATRDLLDCCGGQKFILGAGCALKLATPPEHIDTVIAAARRRGIASRAASSAPLDV